MNESSVSRAAADLGSSFRNIRPQIRGTYRRIFGNANDGSDALEVEVRRVQGSVPFFIRKVKSCLASIASSLSMNNSLLSEYITFLNRELDVLSTEVGRIEIGSNRGLAVSYGGRRSVKSHVPFQECWKKYIRMFHNVQFLRLIETSYFPRSLIGQVEELHTILEDIESRLNLIRPEGLGDEEIAYLRSKSHAALLDFEFQISSASGSSNKEDDAGATEASTESKRRRRVRSRSVVQSVRQSIPVQALALILLGFASLIPMTEDEFGCLVSNNLGSTILQPSLTFMGNAPPI